MLDLCFKHGIKLAVIEAGIAPIVSDTLRKIDQYDTVLVQSYHHPTPESLKNALSLSATDLRGIASEAIQQVVTASSAYVGIAIVANPDVDEAPDTNQGAVVAVYTPAKSAERAYGFGGKSEMAKQFVTTWSLSMLWRMVKEQRES